VCGNYPLREVFFTTEAQRHRETKRTTPCPLQFGGETAEYDLVYVGSLTFERGLKVYLETAKLFKQSGQAFKLLIIGDFKNKTTERCFFDYVAFHGLGDYVVYKSYMPNAEVLKEIGESKVGIFMGDVTLSPRYNKGQNMKLLEYLSQKVPVIVNKLAMSGEFVERSQSGWVIDYNSRALFVLLCEILQDEALLRTKGEQGYEYVRDNLLWEYQEAALYEAVFGESL
jgi:glycosyltransferase involved in cell wall biosynthesis